ncbi:MAG: sodium/proline symporter [Sphingomonadales bacterium]|nr:sodium/proline symporter [Sphingomonadales bacterium]
MKGEITILVVVVAYLALMMTIGLLARGKDPSKKDYYLAGRRLPYWVIAFSMNATGESAWLLLGLSGLGYVVGVQAFWVVIGETIGIWLSWSLVAKRLNAVARASDAVTLPDVLADRLGDPLQLVRILSVLIILVMVAVYVAAQMLATGKAFETFLGWPYVAGVVVGGVVTVTYTSFGGFRGVAYTDTAQALLMLFAVTAVPVAGLVAIGGLTGLSESLSALDPTLLAPIGGSSADLVAILSIASALAIGLPFLGVPQLLVRYIATRDAAEISKARNISVTVIFLLGFGAVSTGLVGRALYPGLADGETIMPTLSEELFPPFVTGLLVAAVLSAVMSTVSSLLNLASSAVVSDLYHKFFSPSADSRAVARLGVWVTAVLGVLGCVIALNQQGLIFNFVLFAWAGLGAAFGPVILCVLRWPRTTWQGALAGMIGGFGITVVWISVFKTRFYDLYEMIPGFIGGLLITVVVSLLTAPREALRRREGDARRGASEVR